MQQIKVFVINLQRSNDRRAHIKKLMEIYSIRFEFFGAIDGNLLSLEFIEKCRIRSNKWYHEDESEENSMKTGEIGVALSHYYIYQKIQDENIDFAVILEDDIILDSRFGHFVQAYKQVKVMMQKFDLLLLGYCGHDVDYYRPADCSFWGRLNLGDIFMAGLPVQWCWSAIGYVISLKGARLLMEKQGEYPCVTADILTANSPEYGVRLGVLRQQIIWPGELNNMSTIQGRELNKSFYSLTADEKSKELHSTKSIASFQFYQKKLSEIKEYLEKQKKKLSLHLYPFTQSKY